MAGRAVAGGGSLMNRKGRNWKGNRRVTHRFYSGLKGRPFDRPPTTSFFFFGGGGGGLCVRVQITCSRCVCTLMRVWCMRNLHWNKGHNYIWQLGVVEKNPLRERETVCHNLYIHSLIQFNCIQQCRLYDGKTNKQRGGEKKKNHKKMKKKRERENVK